ncbi:hypothetical protein Hanom_Chr16g01467901 [Helianthus anomalus]
MSLYPRFLTLIFRHLLPNLPFDDHTSAYIQTPMHRRIFKDCRTPKETIHGNVFPLFEAGHDVDVPQKAVQQPLVVQPQVDLQQPPPIMPEPVIEELVVVVREAEDVSVSQPMDAVPSLSEAVDLVMRDRVDMVLEQPSTSVVTSAPIGLAEMDPVIIALDATLETGSSSKRLDKGKRVVEESVIDTIYDMLTQKEYFNLVRRDMLNKISPSNREKLDLFRGKVVSFGPSSGWGLRLADSNNKLNDLSLDTVAEILLQLSTSISLTIITKAIQVESTCVTSSIVDLPPVSSSPIPSAPLFISLRTLRVQVMCLVFQKVREIAYWKRKDELKTQLLTYLFHLTKEQGSQLGQLIRNDAGTAAKHETLVKAIDQIHQIITDLVELLVALGENTALQVQAQCKIDDLNKIRDDLDKDKDPKAARQGAQTRSSQASKAATVAQVEGESGSEAEAGQDRVLLLMIKAMFWLVRMETRKWFKSLPDQTQKKRYVNTKGEYKGQIKSWDFEEQHSLVINKQTYGVQYFSSWAKFLQTLPIRDLHHLAQLDLNNHTNIGSIRGLIPHLVAESRESKWKTFKPAVGQAVKTRDKFTDKQVLKMVYPPARCLLKIPMRKFDLDKIQGIGFWYLDRKTGEAVITKKIND